MSRTVSRERAAYLLAEWTQLFMKQDLLCQLERQGVLPLQPKGNPMYNAENLLRARLAVVLRDWGIRTPTLAKYVSYLLEHAKGRGDTTLTVPQPGGCKLTITIPVAKFKREAEEAVDSLITV